MQQLEDGGPDPLVFVLNANLLSMVKIVNCKFFLFYEDCKDIQYCILDALRTLAYKIFFVKNLLLKQKILYSDGDKLCYLLEVVHQSSE